MTTLTPRQKKVFAKFILAKKYGTDGIHGKIQMVNDYCVMLSGHNVFHYNEPIFVELERFYDEVVADPDKFDASFPWCKVLRVVECAVLATVLVSGVVVGGLYLRANNS